MIHTSQCFGFELANLLRLLTRHRRRRIPPPQQIIQKRPCHHRQLPPGRIRGVPVAQDGETLDVEHGELAWLVEREGVAGERGDAQPGEDGLLDGFVAAEFEARVEGGECHEGRTRLSNLPCCWCVRLAPP
jgi:hypothetical protein